MGRAVILMKLGDELHLLGPSYGREELLCTTRADFQKGLTSFGGGHSY